MTFAFDSCFLKQMDGCTMGGPLSVTISDIYMIKTELDVVKPTKPKLYRCFVDNIFIYGR